MSDSGYSVYLQYPTGPAPSRSERQLAVPRLTDPDLGRTSSLPSQTVPEVSVTCPGARQVPFHYLLIGYNTPDTCDIGDDRKKLQCTQQTIELSASEAETATRTLAAKLV